ncbi:MAG: hypothetical protein WCK65_13620 [Rhodospirillaceae bacterium]
MMRVGKFAFAGLVLAAMMVALPSAPARADMVVVRAAGGSLKPGQTVATGVVLRLPPGATATLMSQDGKTVSLTGPFSGAPESVRVTGGDPKVVTALSRLLTAGTTDKASLGVTRGTHIRDPYAITKDGGSHCQVADRPPEFTRGMAIGSASVSITSAAGTESTVNWDDGSATAAWPPGMPFIDGTYLLGSGRTAPVKLIIRRMPSDVIGMAAQAAWMGEHGCRVQALALLDSIH